MQQEHTLHHRVLIFTSGENMESIKESAKVNKLDGTESTIYYKKSIGPRKKVQLQNKLYNLRQGNKDVSVGPMDVYLDYVSAVWCPENGDLEEYDEDSIQEALMPSFQKKFIESGQAD